MPQIAAFFDVSIDELFGVSDYDKILFLARKYSAHRNDVNFREAMRYLDMELMEDDGNLKLLALKLHMFLQRSREYHGKALELCEELIPMARDEDRELYAAFTMQRLQFLAEERRDGQILEECLERYRAEKTILHLQFYFDALLLTDNERKVLAFPEEDDFARGLVEKPDRDARAVYDQLYKACRHLKDAEGEKKYKRLAEQFSA